MNTYYHRGQGEVVRPDMEEPNETLSIAYAESEGYGKASYIYLKNGFDKHLASLPIYAYCDPSTPVGFLEGYREQPQAFLPVYHGTIRADFDKWQNVSHYIFASTLVPTRIFLLPPDKGEKEGSLKVGAIERMEELQDEMHKTIDWMMNRNPKLTYQDCVTTYLLFHIAQLKKQ